jgi:4-amino-4-deoxy-L-arabinose transferase-like glycosyltransferase
VKFRDFRDSLVAMVVVALAVRLAAAVFLYPDVLAPRLDHWPFGYEAGRIARAIALGRGFSDPLFGQTGPTAWLAPVFPYVLATIFRLLGIFTKASALAILSLDSLFSALTCVPIFLIARRAFHRETGVLAGWVWAFFPFAVYFSADFIWDTCLTTLLLTVLFLVALLLANSRSLWAWAAFGALWGAAALSDPTVLSLLPFLAGWALFRGREQGRRMAPAAIMLAAALVVVLPWQWRNYARLHRLVPIRDSFWLAMRVGNTGHLANHWSLEALPGTNPAEMEKFRRLGELAYMAENRRQVLSLIRARPGWFAWATLRRVLYFWTGFWTLPSANANAPLSFFDPDQPFDLATLVLSTSVTLLAVVGLWSAFRRRNPIAWPCLLVLLVFPGVYYLADPDVRYRHPIEPVLIVLASYAVRAGSLRLKAAEASG